MERKSGDGTKPFTRFITHPETAAAATLATDNLPAERFIAHETAGATPVFGKIRHQQELEYRPSRLQHVMLDAWTHSRIGWLDRLGTLKVICLSLVLAGIVAVILWPYLKEVFRKRNQGNGAASVVAAVVLPSDPIRQEAIRRSFDAYRSAAGIEEKLKWVIEPQRVESRLKDFYQGQGQQDPEIASYEVSAPIRAGAEWWFTINYVSVEGLKSSVSMKETPAGGQLDWENFVAYGSIPWGKFTSERPSAAHSMRARLRLSSSYTGKYQRGEYIAYEISHRSGPPILRGYALKNSRSGQLLAAEPGLENWKAMNLYLRWEPDAGNPDALFIEDVIWNNWLDAVPAPPSSSLPLPAAPAKLGADKKAPPP